MAPGIRSMSGDLENLEETAEGIMASGHMNRVKRPDTWLHRPMLRNVKKVLANPEPSTHGTNRTSKTFMKLLSIDGCRPFLDLAMATRWLCRERYPMRSRPEPAL
jgi:hypothetical protein